MEFCYFYHSHEGPVWQLAWAHPRYGQILASCSYDRKVILWREEHGSWSQLYIHSQHDSSVNSVQWSPYEHGLVLACGSSDGSISILKYISETNSWVILRSSHILSTSIYDLVLLYVCHFHHHFLQ